MRLPLLALAASASLCQAGLCGPASRPAKPVKPVKPARVASSQSKNPPSPPSSGSVPNLDLQKWPAYPGAETVTQVFLSGDQLAGLAGSVPPNERAALGKLTAVTVLEYRLPAAVIPKEVLAFYEPHVLRSGFKVMVRDMSEPGEASVVYTGPNRGIVVISVDEGEGKGKKLEIVSVRGDLAGLEALSGLKQKQPPQPAQPPAPRVPDPDE